ncbi:hypothetical protein HN419_03490 [Candidatus Woesearchaeota archaeon]|jgi:hypothetical protein|nr:hypothetical protein [Candidatus Woesearchaeota archaeon]MBT3538059.1 hypothetical protein [Candidatus Woesearchaeota archaeon]MBT4697143.1 hypothetical protein [Candidatus Woesearchaeota archaeon]MBT4717134.1 hypothetical protein [Candidatus Woesearchaeota archaeon]MBT7105728.1 hypothetical protein [Candidatus Woesearchaeota archaeon]
MTEEKYRSVKKYSASELVSIEREMRSRGKLVMGLNENLVERAIDDLLVLAEMEVDVADIAAKLEDCRWHLFEEIHGPRGLQGDFSDLMGSGTEIDSNYSVRGVPFEGAVKCPFLDPGKIKYLIHSYIVTRTSDDETLRFTDLGLHMLKEHHFFSGVEGYTRVDPEKAIDFFKLG